PTSVCVRADVGNATNARAVSGVASFFAMPAEYVVTFWTSFGSGPTSVTPLTGTISLIWCTTISTSPLATSSAGEPPGTRVVFGFTASALPQLWRQAGEG